MVLGPYNFSFVAGNFVRPNKLSTNKADDVEDGDEVWCFVCWLSPSAYVFVL